MFGNWHPVLAVTQRPDNQKPAHQAQGVEVSFRQEGEGRSCDDMGET
jgi:hypothetical protein